MADTIRVLLADDHPALRVGLKVLLDRAADIEVVGEADDGAMVLEMAAIQRPDVVVLACQLPEIDGVAVALALRDHHAPIRVLALSAYDDDRYLAGMAEAGALGYLLKNEAPGRIVEAVHMAMEGRALWTPEQKGRVQRWREDVGRLGESLTAREREVLRLIADGLSNKEISQTLKITVRTADFHVSNILRKLEVISRVEAAVWASDHRSFLDRGSP